MQHCIRRHRTLRRPGDDQNSSAWTHKSKTLGPNLALMVRNKVSDLSVIDRVAFTNHVALSLAPWCTAAPQYHIPVYDAFGRGVCEGVSESVPVRTIT